MQTIAWIIRFLQELSRIEGRVSTCCINNVRWLCFFERLHLFVNTFFKMFFVKHFLLCFVQLNILTLSSSKKTESWWWATIFDLVTYNFDGFVFRQHHFYFLNCLINFCCTDRSFVILIYLRPKHYWQFSFFSGF